MVGSFLRGEKNFSVFGGCEKGFSEGDAVVIRTLRATIRVYKSLGLVEEVLFFLDDRVFWRRELRGQGLGQGCKPFKFASSAWQVSAH